MHHLNSEITIPAANITFNFSDAETVTTVKSYLHNILTNLVSNAIKYHHQRNPEIKIQSFNTKDFVCVTVEDNGLGLDINRYGSRIFGLYNNFHKGVSQGRGIGLKLIKAQAEALGGKVELESHLGEGSMFKVYLPHKLES